MDYKTQETAIVEQKKPDLDNLYRNPIINRSLPDPTIIKAEDDNFYLYATEDTRNTPIYKSANLVDWQFVGTAFTELNPDPDLSRRRSFEHKLY